MYLLSQVWYGKFWKALALQIYDPICDQVQVLPKSQINPNPEHLQKCNNTSNTETLMKKPYIWNRLISAYHKMNSKQSVRNITCLKELQNRGGEAASAPWPDFSFCCSTHTSQWSLYILQENTSVMFSYEYCLSCKLLDIYIQEHPRHCAYDCLK